MRTKRTRRRYRRAHSARYPDCVPLQQGQGRFCPHRTHKSVSFAFLFNNELGGAPTINPDPIPVHPPIVSSGASRITQLVLQTDTPMSTINRTMLVLEAVRFAGDGLPPSPRAAWIWWPVGLNNEHRTAAVSNPDATPITINAPGIVLATGGITQSPLEPNPSHSVGPTISIPAPLRFTGDGPPLPRKGTICKPRIFLCGSIVERKEGHNQEGKSSEIKEFLHSNLSELAFSG